MKWIIQLPDKVEVYIKSSSILNYLHSSHLYLPKYFYSSCGKMAVIDIESINFDVEISGESNLETVLASIDKNLKTVAAD